MIHEGPRHTHRARGSGPRDAHLLWSFAADGPIEAQVTAAPDETTLYVATLGGSLIALGRAGEERWRVALGGRAYGAPCVAEDGTIYVGSDAHAFRAVTPEGRVRWTLETTGEADTSGAMTPDGAVVFAAGREVFLVSASGDVLWRFAAKGKVFTSPAVAGDGTVIVGAQDHHVYAITKAGALAWKVDLGQDVDGAAVIAEDGAVFVGTDGGEVVRLDAAGNIVFRAPVGGFVRGALSLSRTGEVLAGTYGPVPRVVRVAADGKVREVFTEHGTGAREFGIHGGPLEDDRGTLLFGTQADAVYAVNTAGDVLFRFATGDDVDAPVTLLGDGTLLVASDDGKVYALGP